MFQMNTIVLTLDGSEGAKRAIPPAVGLAQREQIEDPDRPRR